MPPTDAAIPEARQYSIRSPCPQWVRMLPAVVACTTGCGGSPIQQTETPLASRGPGHVATVPLKVVANSNVSLADCNGLANDLPEHHGAALGQAALERLTVTELIDLFQKESRHKDPAYIPSTSAGFAPTAERMVLAVAGAGGKTEDRPATASPLMREIVRRGVAALPALLEHVSDERPTRLRVEHSGAFGDMWFSDEYDPQNFTAEQQAMGVRTSLREMNGFENTRPGKRFTVHVGDLCYVAIGQIVGRSLSASHYQPTGCTVVNSPIQNPALAAAVRSDWTGLTADAHRQSLVDDSMSADNGRIVCGIERLFFYYPDDAESIALTLLARPVKVSPARDRSSDPDQASFDDSVNPGNLAQLINAVGRHSTPKMQNAIYRIYLVAAESHEAGRIGRYHWDGIAVSCIYALAGDRHDAEFKDFVDRRIEQLQSEPPGQTAQYAIQEFKNCRNYLEQRTDGQRTDGPSGAG